MEDYKMELIEIKELLKDRNLYVVAREAGVSYSALTRWVRGETSSPSYELVTKVQHYLKAA